MKTMLEVFGIHCFSEKELKSRVPKDVFKSFKKVQSGKEELSITTANVIANAIKLWAIENGATHFTHWFQPLTELTAEKHEAFLSVHSRSEEHTSELQSRQYLVCRLLLEKKNYSMS